MTGRPLAIGLIGAGGIAQQYAKAFEDCPEVKPVGVADTRREAARDLSARLGCTDYPSYRALAERPGGLDAVVICTPPATHEEVSVHFLRRGVHVLCEKPLALNAASAERMIRAAEAAGRVLTMASKFRYVDDVVRSKGIVSSGAIGEVVLFENAFTSRVPMADRWNSDPAVSGGGVLIDNGTHSVDIMRYFLGPLASVQVVEGKRVQGLAVEDTALIFARSEAGVMGHIDLSWSINKEIPSYINIYGSTGTVSVGWKGSQFRQSSSPDWVSFGKGYDKSQAFRDQVRNFARAIAGEEELRITAEDGLASVRVIETAYQSLRQENWLGVAASAATNGQAKGPGAPAGARP